MDKAILTQAQAEAVNLLKKVHPESSIVRMHVEYPKKWSKDFEGVNGMELDLLIRALYIGYEVEQTLEEKRYEAFDEITDHDGCFCGESVAEANGFHAGFITALKIAGIEVPGITD
ncbi:hypothetical protein [Paenibacillus sp. F4]|uniref:hypothetical protein n=1 Tax=Paenibacillus sp. F4 TaxID=357385 RepID=UPI000C9F137A|nr:hypothetical protein [Paenibacillus sp. F4]PNQ83098.1 hypothetical protein C1T21_00650 [Paenibacillus sp. F4]